MSTSWLFVLIVWAHMGYYLFPNQWAAFASGLGLLSAALLWSMRGERFSIRWFIVLFGVQEGLQVFICQMSFNWFPLKTQAGMCEAYTGWPLTWYGLWCASTLAYWFSSTARLNR